MTTNSIYMTNLYSINMTNTDEIIIYLDKFYISLI